MVNITRPTSTPTTITRPIISAVTNSPATPITHGQTNLAFKNLADPVLFPTDNPQAIPTNNTSILIRYFNQLNKKNLPEKPTVNTNNAAFFTQINNTLSDDQKKQVNEKIVDMKNYLQQTQQILATHTLSSHVQTCLQTMIDSPQLRTEFSTTFLHDPSLNSQSLILPIQISLDKSQFSVRFQGGTTLHFSNRGNENGELRGITLRNLLSTTPFTSMSDLITQQYLTASDPFLLAANSIVGLNFQALMEDKDLSPNQLLSILAALEHEKIGTATVKTTFPKYY